MSIMLKEETNNSSLVAAIQPPLTPVPSKTPPRLPPPVPTPVPTIAAAYAVTIASALLALSTRVQLDSTVNRK